MQKDLVQELQLENNRINRKDQQSAGGNWGHPRPFTKKHTDIPDRTDEVGKRRASKKYKEKKVQKPYHVCPFCQVELLEVLTSKEADAIFKKGNYVTRWWLSGMRARKCKNCGARNLTKACPCCKRDTWFDKKTKFYKHESRSWSWCGFVGAKKQHGRV